MEDLNTKEFLIVESAPSMGTSVDLGIAGSNNSFATQSFISFPGGSVNVGDDGNTSVDFPGGSVDAGSDGTTVDFPGGSVNVGDSGGTEVDFPGGSVDAGSDGTTVDFPGGSVDAGSDGTTVDFPGGNVGVNIGDETTVNFPGGSVEVDNEVFVNYRGGSVVVDTTDATNVSFPGGSVNVDANGNTFVEFPRGKVVVEGSSGTDRFVFSGRNQARALKTSRLRKRDRIKDFSFSDGDKFVLDFDNDLETRDRPRRLFNAGRQRGRNLRLATEAAYEDKLPRRGDQSLRSEQAVIFKYRQRTYLSVNDGNASFSLRKDLLVNITGIEFDQGDGSAGALRVADYFL